ncbi:MAG: tetratricopeptide repeat protein [Gemmatimonadetes bacterium]|nr:tetratricopeptide repeat protein [Gemmatimonadota bacterium]
MARADAARQEGRFEEALKAYVEIAGQAERDPRAGAVRADALRGAGICRLAMSDWDGAQEAYEASLAAAEAIRDNSLIGKAFNGLAAVEFERGDWFFARQLYREARRHAREADDRRLLAQIENNEGAMLAARGEREAAEYVAGKLAEVGLDPQLFEPARTMNNLGLVLAAERRFIEAESAFQDALREAERQGDRFLGTTVSINRARLELDRDRPHLALSLARSALDLARERDYKPAAASALCLMGEVSLELNDFVGATRFLRQALDLSSDRQAPLVEAETWVTIARLYCAQNDTPRAIDTYRHARMCYRELGASSEAERILNRIEELREILPIEAERGFAVA